MMVLPSSLPVPGRSAAKVVIEIVVAIRKVVRKRKVFMVSLVWVVGKYIEDDFII